MNPLMRIGFALATAGVAALIKACGQDTGKTDVYVDGPHTSGSEIPDGGTKTDAGTTPVTDRYLDAGTVEDAGTPDAGLDGGMVTQDLRVDVNISSGSFLAYFATDWTNGFFGKFDFQNRQPPLPSESSVSSTDAILRSIDGTLYRLDRINGTLSFRDKSFTLMGNLQDIVIPPNTNKAYISRLDINALWVIDLTNGNLIKIFDLIPYTFEDEDRLARAAQMALVDNRYLLVLLQDLNTDFSANA